MVLLTALSRTKTEAQYRKKGKFLIQQLSDAVYVFTSYGAFDGKFYPANGLYAVGPQGAVIVDGPWDPADRQPLLDSIWNRHHVKVVLCIATHFHTDRTGALAYYRSKKIPTHATAQTDSLCILHHENRAQFLMKKDTTFRVGGLRLETFYPGPGHAPDNIVVWLPKQKILYGGCLYKSIDDQNLGNLSDANLSVWDQSIRRVQKRFGKPEIMIVGHGNWHSLAADEHTISLVEKTRREMKKN